MLPEDHHQPYEEISPALLRDELQNKTVMVTGGGYGIGRSIAQSFAEAGVAQIILVGRTEAKLQVATDELSQSFKNLQVTFQVADITSKDDVKRVFDSLTSCSPDILVNNAGFLSTPTNFMDADFDDYWASFNVNVYGTMLFTQTFLRHRRAHIEAASNSGIGNPAVIIIVNSIGAYATIPNFSSYGANKAALARWSELVSVDIPQDFARFVSVHPGAVESSMGIKSGMVDMVTLTNPQLTGDFIVWLASEEAKFLAGRFISVNMDVKKLLSRKEEIIEKGLYKTSLLV